jgi:predicted ribosome quality control (RQC) complex YloA/Tae2 family protein
MTYDGLSLAALASELTRALLGGKVQKIVQPDEWSIALEVFGQHQRRWLLLSADPQRPRLYLTGERPGRRVEAPSPLLLLLRKHVEGLRIGPIEQPPGERILHLGLYRPAGPAAADDAEAVPPDRSGPGPVLFWLIIEAISQYSNLILTDAAGTVVDAARRISAAQNRTRVTLPHRPYLPPPAQAKRPLAEADAGTLGAALATAGPGGAIWQALVAAFAGLGPLAGREISFRALGDARAKVPAAERDWPAAADRLAEALAAVVEPVRRNDFVASVARGKGSPELVAFAPYALTHLEHWETRASLSEAADEYYRQNGSLTRLDGERGRLLAAIADERSLAERKRQSLLRALEGTGKADDWRERGEALLTYSAQIPRGATAFRTPPDGGRILDLELDPRLSAVENAQLLFGRYRKARSALREVPTLVAEVELRLRYLDELSAWAQLADRTEALQALRAELRPKRSTVPPPRARPNGRRSARLTPAERAAAGILRQRASDGTEILVGRSAQQNHFVTFELARPDDLWLHARGCPGAHVVLRSQGLAPSPRAIEEAAGLAAYFSTNREAARVTVDWTRRKLVRRLGQGTPGLVSYSGEQSLVVQPTPPGLSA